MSDGMEKHGDGCGCYWCLPPRPSDGARSRSRILGGRKDDMSTDVGGPGGTCEDCGHFAGRHHGMQCHFPRDPGNECPCQGMLWADVRYEMNMRTGPVRAVMSAEPTPLSVIADAIEGSTEVSNLSERASLAIAREILDGLDAASFGVVELSDDPT